MKQNNYPFPASLIILVLLIMVGSSIVFSQARMEYRCHQQEFGTQYLKQDGLQILGDYIGGGYDSIKSLPLA